MFGRFWELDACALALGVLSARAGAGSLPLALGCPLAHAVTPSIAIATRGAVREQRRRQPAPVLSDESGFGISFMVFSRFFLPTRRNDLARRGARHFVS